MRAATSFRSATILYEMAMGRRAFEGNSAAGVMAAILEREPPPMSAREPPAPPLLEHIVTRCLAKDPDERWQSAGDVMRELTWVAQTGGRTPEPLGSDIAQPLARAFRLDVCAGAADGDRGAGRDHHRHASIRGRAPGNAARDRDAADVRSLLAGDCPGRTERRLRRHGRGRAAICACAAWTPASPRVLKNTEGGYLPFWSPDGRSIGFAASGQLKRLDLENESVRKLANAPLFLGGTWSRDGLHPVRAEHERRVYSG